MRKWVLGNYLQKGKNALFSEYIFFMDSSISLVTIYKDVIRVEDAEFAFRLVNLLRHPTFYHTKRKHLFSSLAPSPICVGAFKVYTSNIDTQTATCIY